MLKNSFSVFKRTMVLVLAFMFLLMPILETGEALAEQREQRIEGTGTSSLALNSEENKEDPIADEASQQVDKTDTIVQGQSSNQNAEVTEQPPIVVSQQTPSNLEIENEDKEEPTSTTPIEEIKESTTPTALGTEEKFEPILEDSAREEESPEPTSISALEGTPSISPSSTQETTGENSSIIFAQGYCTLLENTKVYLNKSTEKDCFGIVLKRNQVVYALMLENNWMEIAFTLPQNHEIQKAYVQFKNVYPLNQEETLAYKLKIENIIGEVKYYNSQKDLPLGEIEIELSTTPITPTEDQPIVSLAIVDQPQNDEGKGAYAIFEVEINFVNGLFLWERRTIEKEGAEQGETTLNNELPLWEKVPLHTGAEGITSSKLVIPRNQENASYYYRCVVTKGTVAQKNDESADSELQDPLFSLSIPSMALPDQEETNSEGINQSNEEMVVSSIVTMAVPQPEPDNGFINIAPADGYNFRICYSSISDTMTMRLDYQSYSSNETESVTVYLPPFFTLANIPNNTNEYTVTVNPAADFPAQYYTEPEADILKAFDGAKTKVTAITLDFLPTFNSSLTLTFGMSIIPSSSASSTRYTDLSNLMVAYGANPDKIPLKTIAVVKNTQGEEVSHSIYKGSSLITDFTGTQPIENKLAFLGQNSDKNLGNTGYPFDGFHLNRPVKRASADDGLARVDAWHYPITQMVYYIPLPQGMELKNSSTSLMGIEEYIDLEYPLESGNQLRYGKTYALSDMTNIAWNKVHSEYLVYQFVDQDALYPGDTYGFGPVLVDYMYKGTLYEKQKSFLIKDYTVLPYGEPAISHKTYYNNGYNDNAPSKRRAQGEENDKHQIILTNSSLDQPTATYEQAQVNIVFPYEVTPKTIGYTIGQNVANAHSDVLPVKVTYYTYNDISPKTIHLSPEDHFVSFPDEDVSNHIIKVSFHYDIIYSATEIKYDIVARNALTNSQGEPLPQEYPVAIETSLTTASGNRSELWQAEEDTGENKYPLNPRSKVTTPFISAKTTDFILIERPDVLLFGTAYSSAYGSPNIDGQHQSLISVQNQKNTGSLTGAFSPWIMAIMKADGQMKDYEEVTITISPKTQEDKKALSKLSGIRVHSASFYEGVIFENAEVFYPTNKNPQGKTEKITSYVLQFNLALDEYVTGDVVIKLGKINGNEMKSVIDGVIQKTASTSGEVWKNEKSEQYQIEPYFNGYRYYFYEGVPNDTSVKSTDSHQLVATLSTSSTAQHIQGTGALANSTSTGTITYKTVRDSSISHVYNAEVSGWSIASKNYNQNSKAEFLFYDTLGATSNIITYYPKAPQTPANGSLL